MKTSFLIVTYNSLSDLPRLLDSLRRAAGPDDEMLFWDNLSSDGTVAFLQEQRDPRLRLFAATENLGFGRGINRLAQEATGKMLALVNPDCHWDGGNFQAWLLQNSRADLGALAPLIRYDDGGIQPNQGGDSSLSTFILQFLRVGAVIRALGLPKLFTWLFRILPAPPSVHGFLKNFRTTPTASTPDWVSGAFFVTPRQRFVEAGGFDEAYFMYSEDEDLCRRYRGAGWIISFDPAFVVRHAVAGSQKTGGFSKARLERYRSQMIFVLKWQGPAAAAMLKTFWAFAFPIKAMSFATVGRVAAARTELRYWRLLIRS